MRLDLEQLTDGFVLVSVSSQGAAGEISYSNRSAQALFAVDSRFQDRLIAWVRSVDGCDTAEDVLELGLGVYVRVRGHKVVDGCMVQLVRIQSEPGIFPGTEAQLREVVAARQLAEIEAVYANAPVGLCVLDTQLRWVRINHLLAEMNGFPPEAHIGRQVRELLPELADVAESTLRSVIKTGKALEHVEIVGTTPAQPGVERIWVESFFPLRDPRGEIIGVNVVCEEVTEHRRVQQALRDSEQRFRLATEAMRGIVYDWDLKGTLRRSRGLLVVLGYEEREVPATPEAWRALIHPDDLAQVGPKFDAAIRANLPILQFEYRARHKDGRWIYLSDHSVVIYGEDGAPLRLVGCTVSVDERRRAEEGFKNATDQLRQANERLEKLNAQLEAASHAKDRFLAVLSHELRTPLTPVVLSLDALSARDDLPDEVRSTLAMVRRNIELETHLIDDLLDLSRIVSGKLRLTTRELHLHEVLLHAIEMVEPEIRQKQIVFSHAISAPKDLVLADPARLQQILWNLLKNACKFTLAGGRIHVSTQVIDGHSIEVEVADNGVGIPSESIGKIFDAFEQGSSSITRQFGGLGLGLAISKAIVDLHGGTIRAESAGQGRGSRFTLHLPLRQGAAISATTPDSSRSPASVDGLRLLLVEDHADTARVLSRLLEISGHTVEVASSVAEALAAAERQSFDLVVSDLGLPDGSGHDVMRALRSRGLQGIALSGFGMEDDIRRSNESGFVDHLTKPVSATAIRAAIAKWGKRAK